MGAGILDEDKFAFVGTPAWHGLGVEIEAGMTAAAAFKAVGLDWKTQLWPVMAFKPVVEDDGEHADTKAGFDDDVAKAVDEDRANGGDGHPKIEGVFAHVRLDTGRVLGVVSSQYRPIENADLAAFVDSLVTINGMVCVETAGSLWNGRVVYVLIRLPEFTDVVTGDTVKHYLLAVNGHGGSRSFSVYFTSIRVVCANTLVSSEYDMDTGVTFRHIGGMEEKLEAARTVLRLTTERIREFDAKAKAMAATKLSLSQARSFFVATYNTLFVRQQPGQTPLTKDEIDAYERACDLMVGTWISNLADPKQARFGSDTVWAAFNAVTQWIEHGRARSNTIGTNTNINQRLFSGGADMKRKVFGLACALSRV